MSIKPSELRQGNKVYVSDKDIPDKMHVATVGEIFYFEATLECDFGEGEEDCSVEHEDLLPIPLTEEWLLSAGFEGDVFNGYMNTKMRVGFITTDEYFEMEWLCSGHADWQIATIKTVHQLQNLYFALTGEELEFKDLKI